MTERRKLFGLDVEVMSAAELLRARTAPEKLAQVCVRVADAPGAGPISERHARERQRLPCEECDQLCWFDPGSGPGRLFVHLVCIQCFMGRST